MTPQEISGEQPRRIWTWLATTGMFAVVAGLLMPIINFMINHATLQSPLYKFVYSAGALLLLCAKIMSPYRGKSQRLKRLFRLEMWTPVIFCVGAFFLFYEESTQDWIAFTLAGGALMGYTSVMIPVVYRRELKKHAGR